ncbi:MAG: GNAT family N-acetyltransferase [Alphaproteobacteria bacterium]
MDIFEICNAFDELATDKSNQTTLKCQNFGIYCEFPPQCEWEPKIEQYAEFTFEENGKLELKYEPTAELSKINTKEQQDKFNDWGKSYYKLHWIFSIRDKRDMQIGSISVDVFPKFVYCTNIIIDEKEQGKGYGKSAISKFLKLLMQNEAFNFINEIQCSVKSENPKMAIMLREGRFELSEDGEKTVLKHYPSIKDFF